ncbi:MAG: IPExxxVDY family protein [Bacteroidia bacterium]
MAKYSLDEEYDFNFILFAISCHEPDYKLCYALNQALNLNLIREDDVLLKNKKQEDNLLFSFYFYEDESEYVEYNLLSNKSYNSSKTIANPKNKQADLFGETDASANSQKGYLVPELSNADFLLIVRTDYEASLAEELENKIKQLSFVLKVQVIDVGDLPSKKNLIV